MAAIYLGTAGLTFGLVAETGGVIQNVQVRRTREKAVVKNQVGEITTAVYFDPTEEITYDFFVSGSTGVAASSIGVAVTLTNYTPSAGAIYPEEITISKPNNDFVKYSVKAMAHALI